MFGVLPIHRRVLEIAERFLDDDLLSSLTAVETHPVQAAQPLHADDGSIPLSRPHEPLALLALWALTDFTADNGGTRFVPGSHVLGRDQVAAMPPRLRRLVGYGVYRGLQGHVAGVDPGSWFDDDIDRDLVWARMR